MSEYVDLEDAPLPDPHEQRVPCILLIDTSGSMSSRIEQVNQGLVKFKADLMRDSLARKRAEVAVITFGCPDAQGDNVVLVQDFARVDEEFDVPRLSVAGSTPMGRAMIMALNEIEQRKQLYRNQGIQYTRPWLFLITDGSPTDGDTFERAVELANSNQRGVTIFAIGVDGANFESLKRISPEFVLQLSPEFDFGVLFNWLSASIGSAVQSKPGESAQLPAPPEGLQVIM